MGPGLSLRLNAGAPAGWSTERGALDPTPTQPHPDRKDEQDHGETARRRDGQPLKTFIHTLAWVNATLLKVA